MKTNRAIYPLLILVMFVFCLANCKKDENLPVNVSDIEGTYNGTLTTHIPRAPIDPVPSSSISTLTKSSGITVILEWNIDYFTGKPYKLDGIKVSRSGNIYSLSWSTYFEGKVEGNKLTWTYDDGIIVETFSGTK